MAAPQWEGDERDRLKEINASGLARYMRRPATHERCDRWLQRVIHTQVPINNIAGAVFLASLLGPWIGVTRRDFDGETYIPKGGLLAHIGLAAVIYVITLPDGRALNLRRDLSDKLKLERRVHRNRRQVGLSPDLLTCGLAAADPSPHRAGRRNGTQVSFGMAFCSSSLFRFG